jgi:hypothetical protein
VARHRRNAVCLFSRGPFFVPACRSTCKRTPLRYWVRRFLLRKANCGGSNGGGLLKLFLCGYRWFESISLQGRVINEPRHRQSRRCSVTRFQINRRCVTEGPSRERSAFAATAGGLTVHPQPMLFRSFDHLIRWLTTSWLRHRIRLSTRA